MTAGQVPKFDNEFEVDSQSENPLFLLFLPGSRSPKRSSESHSLVSCVLLLIKRLNGLVKKLTLSCIPMKLLS